MVKKNSAVIVVLLVFVLFAACASIFWVRVHPRTTTVVGRVRYVNTELVKRWFGLISNQYVALVIRNEQGQEWRVGSEVGGELY